MLKRQVSLFLAVLASFVIFPGTCALAGGAVPPQSTGAASALYITPEKLVDQAVSDGETSVTIPQGDSCTYSDLQSISDALGPNPELPVRFDTRDAGGGALCRLLLFKADIDNNKDNADFRFDFRTGGDNVENLSGLMNKYYPGHSVATVTFGNMAFQAPVKAVAIVPSISRMEPENIYFYYYNEQEMLYYYGGKARVGENGYVYFAANGLPVFFSEGMLPGAE